MEIQRVQFAFKDSMIHIILQFTLLIATGHVLHRYTSLEIHRQQLLLYFSLVVLLLLFPLCTYNCYLKNMVEARRVVSAQHVPLQRPLDPVSLNPNSITQHSSQWFYNA